MRLALRKNVSKDETEYALSLKLDEVLSAKIKSFRHVQFRIFAEKPIRT